MFRCTFTVVDLFFFVDGAFVCPTAADPAAVAANLPHSFVIGAALFSSFAFLSVFVWRTFPVFSYAVCTKSSPSDAYVKPENPQTLVSIVSRLLRITHVAFHGRRGRQTGVTRAFERSWSRVCMF